MAFIYEKKRQEYFVLFGDLSDMDCALCTYNPFCGLMVKEAVHCGAHHCYCNNFRSGFSKEIWNINYSHTQGTTFLSRTNASTCNRAWNTKKTTKLSSETVSVVEVIVFLPPPRKKKGKKGQRTVYSSYFPTLSVTVDIFCVCVCVSFYNFFSMQQSEQRVVQVIYIEKVN